MQLRGGIVALLALLMLPLATSTAAEPIHLQLLPQPNPAATFDRMQWQVDLDRTYQNPFNPDEISVDAIFHAPSGASVLVPAFWDGSEKAATGKSPAFYVRFAPNEPGTWGIEINATDSSGKRNSSRTTFEVAAGKSRGFIRRAPNNRYLQFDSGDSYFPVGLNLCWAPGDQREEWYAKSFDRLAAQGVNFVRIWMCHRPVMLESAKTGLGRYDLTNAAFFDHVLASAQEHGIGVMLCFINHREFLEKDMWGTGDWANFAYNAKNGGPATRPVDFFINPDARRVFKARLRYMAARYSAFTSLAFWEFFNEQEYARVTVPLAWNAEMAAYLRQVDPAKHLITTSAAVSPAVWELPEFDLTQSHIYGDGTQIDMVTPIASSFRDTKTKKPHLVAELGIDSAGPDTKYDPNGKGTAVHNGLWAGMVSGNAGTGMYWWWDNYIEPKNLWHEFKPVAAFAAQIDWARKQFEPVAITELSRQESQPGYSDLVLDPSGGWGSTVRQTIVIPPNGRPTISVPRWLYGPQHTDLTSPAVIEIDLPQPSQLVVGVAQVSDYAVVRISVDDKPVADLQLSALPGSPDVQKFKYVQEHQLYQSTIEKDKPISPVLPAGHHKVKLDMIAGDWMTLSHITFTNALAWRYANLAALAVQDHSSQETLVWIWDTRSNWKDDQTHEAPPAEHSVQLTIPNINTGTFKAQWWDTRKGDVISSNTVTANAGSLRVDVPTFTRDIALRLNRD